MVRRIVKNGGKQEVAEVPAASRTSCAQLGGNSTQSPQTSKSSPGISFKNDGILDDPFRTSLLQKSYMFTCDVQRKSNIYQANEHSAHQPSLLIQIRPLGPAWYPSNHGKKKQRRWLVFFDHLAILLTHSHLVNGSTPDKSSNKRHISRASTWDLSMRLKWKPHLLLLFDALGIVTSWKVQLYVYLCNICMCVYVYYIHFLAWREKTHACGFKWSNAFGF